jgi:putative hemolysin
MDGDGWLQLILLILFLLGASYCASSEIAFSSLNTIRVKNLADKGDKRAGKALYIIENFDKALTTLLIGNNITHIAFASLVTLIVTQKWGTQYVKYGSLVSTGIVFLFSEMLPKSYAKSNLNYALGVSGSLKALIKIFKPLTRFFNLIADLITRLFGVREKADMSQEDFYEIMKAVEEEEILDTEKQKLMHSALDFDTTTVGDIFTPLDDVEAIDISTSAGDIIRGIKESQYSRLPVYRGSKDNIIGVLQARKFLRAYVKKEHNDIHSLILKPVFVSMNIPIDNLLRRMSGDKNHICIVRDGNQKVMGIVTLEDILEKLVGEIWEENDAEKGCAT